MKIRFLLLFLFATTAATAASVETRLSRSEAPRDWALAAELLLVGARLDERDALIRKAAEAAPDDVLVQWLAVLNPPRAAAGSPQGGLDQARRLAALEPDNAAHWLLLLKEQNAAGDDAGVDETLARMAAATRFDEHYRDYLLAWADAWRRFPPRRSQLATEFWARMAAAPFPAYEAPVKACDPAGRADAQVEARRANCRAIVRRLLEGRTYIAQVTGYAMLRRMNEMTPEDEAAWLAARWTMAKGTALAESGDLTDAATAQRWLDAWRDVGNEQAIFRGWLEKAGIPLTPPAGWEPPTLGVVASGKN